LSPILDGRGPHGLSFEEGEKGGETGDSKIGSDLKKEAPEKLPWPSVLVEGTVEVVASSSVSEKGLVPKPLFGGSRDIEAQKEEAR